MAAFEASFCSALSRYRLGKLSGLDVPGVTVDATRYDPRSFGEQRESQYCGPSTLSTFPPIMISTHLLEEF